MGGLGGPSKYQQEFFLKHGYSPGFFLEHGYSQYSEKEGEMKAVRLYNEKGEHFLSLVDNPDLCDEVDLCTPDGDVLWCGVEKGIFEIFLQEASKTSECWYFTFGVDHFHKNDIVKIYGDVDETRRKMNVLFGSHWAFQYSKTDGEAQIKKYKYNTIEIGE